MRRRKIWQWLMDLPLSVVLPLMWVGYSGLAFIPAMPGWYLGTFPVGIVLAPLCLAYVFTGSWLASCWLARRVPGKHECTD